MTKIKLATQVALSQLNDKQTRQIALKHTVNLSKLRVPLLAT